MRRSSFARNDANSPSGVAVVSRRLCGWSGAHREVSHGLLRKPHINNGSQIAPSSIRNAIAGRSIASISLANYADHPQAPREQAPTSQAINLAILSTTTSCGLLKSVYTEIFDRHNQKVASVYTEDNKNDRACMADNVKISGDWLNPFTWSISTLRLPPVWR